jgi:hypothetical protein
MSQKKTKISKRYAKMMQFNKKFGGAAKGEGGACTQPMYPLYTPSNAKDPLSKPSLKTPTPSPFRPPSGSLKTSRPPSSMWRRFCVEK